MRRLAAVFVLITACAKQEPPVQDPLDYLRVGVDPREEAAAIVDQLERNGFEVGRRIDEDSYVALDAASGPESLVRIVTFRGVALSLEAPDVRWPERLWVSLAAADFAVKTAVAAVALLPFRRLTLRAAAESL